MDPGAYGVDTVHDFMHAKVTVCDDTAFVGSFNLSHSGEQNAENVLEIHDAAVAERMAGFVDRIRAFPVRAPSTTSRGRRHRRSTRRGSSASRPPVRTRRR